MDKSVLRWNGWGLCNGPDILGEHAEGIWDWLGSYVGLGTLPSTPARPLKEIELPPSCLRSGQLDALRRIFGEVAVKTDSFERAYHCRGRSYHDLLWLRAGKLDTAPDAVVYPRSVEQVMGLVEYASREKIALIPYGGGSSVVGGVTPPVYTATRPPVVTVDMDGMNAILDINRETMIAHVEAGIYGPQLEKQLQEQGITLGHYPQSFEYSTLGGWIAARGAGHQSNKYGKAEDWLAGARIISPRGAWLTESFPKSAAGPMFRDLVPGCEGAYGIITDAWVRVQVVPEKKVYRAYLFQDFLQGANAIRTILQHDIPTAMMRLSDRDETFFYSVLHGGADVAANGPIGFCLLLIGFEGEEGEVDHNRMRADEILGRCGGADMGGSMGEKWLNTRFETPYLRDPMMDRGLGVDTIETAASWDRIPLLHQSVSKEIKEAMVDSGSKGGRGLVMAHVSHSYRDGASLYFTFVFARDKEDEVGQWLKIKRCASDVIVGHGGTISHHHGVGLDHLPWLGDEKGPIGRALLAAVKQTLDPENIMNPGKLAP